MNSGQSLIKENGHNSRTSDDIDIKLGAITKLENITFADSVSEIRPPEFSELARFLANSEHSGGRISDTESAKVMFSVTVTFCLTKIENKTKEPLTQLSHYSFE